MRRDLLAWYRGVCRDLPWRRSKAPYPIWLSEVMLQQTRVATVIPYFEKFLERFPTVQALARAPEQELLNAWAGLGYYSRARNLQRGARAIAAQGAFPNDYDSIRAIPGVGDYTAAAIASIAFDLPYAVLDGNVMRVIARLFDDHSDIASQRTRKLFAQRAQELLDPGNPGDFNQAVMELGAVVCLPREPTCLLCPLQSICRGRESGRARSLPVKAPRRQSQRIARTLLIIESGDSLLLWQRPPDSSLMPGFWEFPEPEHLPGASTGQPVGKFRHAITHHDYRFTVFRATIFRETGFRENGLPATGHCANNHPAELEDVPPGFRWIHWDRIGSTPLSTIATKALDILAAAEKSPIL